MLMGAAVETVEGVSGLHHCKAIDLVPDFVGAMLGVMIVLLARRIASAKPSRRNDHDSAKQEAKAIL